MNRKNSVNHLTTLLITIIVWCFVFCIGTACAEASATERILIYNQEYANAVGGSNDGQQACRNLILSGSGNTMGSAGCGIYAMSHAYQWITGDKRNLSNAAGLLSMFINSNISGGSNAPWNGSLDTKYGSILVNNYGAIRASYPTNESSWTQFFNKGGAAIIRIPNWTYQSGHYFCAVGALSSSQTGTGEMWLHIVDSSCGSTFKRLYKAGCSAYSFTDHGAINSSNGNGFWRGDQYYISLSTFNKAGLSVVGAYLPSTPPQPSDNLKYVNVVYPATFKIDTTNGWWLQGGTLESNYMLTTLKSEILSSSGAAVSSYSHAISGYQYSVKTIDNGASENGVKFSKITSAGRYTWRLTATDSGGRTLVMDMPINAVSSGSTSTATMSKTLNEDTTKPTISEVRVYEVSSSGYTVSCKVSDNVGVTKVAFPTWTENNGQDDLFSNWPNTALGTISNGIATYRVKTSDHNNETGCKYITHIYAYDAAGNTGSVNQGNFEDLYVDVPLPTISTTGIQLDRHYVNVNLGMSGNKSFTLVASIYPDNATNKTVHWWSDDQSIARVDENGLVTPGSAGTTTITAMAEDGGYQDTCTVSNSTWISSIALNQTMARLNLGNAETLRLTTAITPSTATNKTLHWSSTDESVARVSSDGFVTPTGEGITTITCTAQDPGGCSAQCVVTVYRDIDVASVTLNRNRLSFSSLSDSENVLLTASVLPENATRTTLTWKSSNENVAMVLYGTVVPLNAGYTRITCTAESGASAVCDVIIHSNNILHLPAALDQIDNEAFYGSAIQEVMIPHGTTSIGSRAFGNCGNLSLVFIPDSVTSIASDAFMGSSNITFICDDVCVATYYAQSRGIPYILGTMPEEVQVFTYKDTLVVGESMSLFSIVQPDAAPQSVQWSILEGSSIASIEAMGNECMLTAYRPGTVMVAGTAFNGVVGAAEISIVDHPLEYAIWFDSNGGDCDVTYADGEYGKAIGTLPTPTRDYYSFNGWYTGANDGTEVTSSTVFSDYNMEELTLYAHWTEHPWSEWVGAGNLPSGEILKESKTQYRYQDASYSAWSGWSAWTITRESTSELKKEESATVYYWYRYVCPHCGVDMHVYDKCYTWAGGCGNSIGSSNAQVTWLTTTPSQGTQNWLGTGRIMTGSASNNRWFLWTDSGNYPNGCSETGYRYATRTKSWGTWSSWSDTVATASGSRNVETRTVYRYKVK